MNSFKNLMKDSTWDKIELLVGIAILLFFASTPLFIQSSFTMNMVVMTLIVAFMGMSWNFLGGITGQIFVGGGVIFFGVGGYASTILLVRYGINPWLGLLAGAAIAVVFALMVAKLTLSYSIKGDYLALFSIALSQILAMTFVNFSFLGGAYGFNLPLVDDSLLMMTWTSKTPYLYLAITMVFLILLLTYYVKNSKMGLYWTAIRENDDAAETLGVATSYYKTLAMCLTAGLGAMGGTLYAQYTTFIEPQLIFGLPQNFEFLMPVIVGGKGTILGPLLGAALLKPMSEIIRSMIGGAQAGFHLMVYGAILVVAILYFPAGIIGMFKKAYYKRKRGA